MFGRPLPAIAVTLLSALFIAFLAAHLSVAPASAADLDRDGLDDAVETTIIDKYAPRLYFDSGNTRWPCSVDWYVRHSVLKNDEGHIFIPNDTLSVNPLALLHADRFGGPTSSSMLVLGSKSDYHIDPDDAIHNGQGPDPEASYGVYARVTPYGGEQKVYSLPERYPHVSETRTVEVGPGALLLQYWMFFPYNDAPFPNCCAWYCLYTLCNWFDHEGDWAWIDVFTDNTPPYALRKVVYHHHGDSRCPVVVLGEDALLPSNDVLACYFEEDCHEPWPNASSGNDCNLFPVYASLDYGVFLPAYYGNFSHNGQGLNYQAKHIKNLGEPLRPMPGDAEVQLAVLFNGVWGKYGGPGGDPPEGPPTQQGGGAFEPGPAVGVSALVPAGLALSRTTTAPGDGISPWTATVANTSPEPINYHYTSGGDSGLVRVFLSTDPEITRTDRCIATFSGAHVFDAFATHTFEPSSPLTIPCDVPPGHYYLGVGVVDNFTTAPDAVPINVLLPDGVLATVGTMPGGISFTVDGFRYGRLQQFNWRPGSTHSLSVDSVLVLSPDSLRLEFRGWSPNNSPATAIVVTPNCQQGYWARFDTCARVVVSTDPGGVIAGPGGWLPYGSVLPLGVRVSDGYCFSGWEGSGVGAYSGPDLHANIRVTGPFSEHASLHADGDAKRVLVGASPDTIPVEVDSRMYHGRRTICWVAGAVHEVDAPEVVSRGPSSRLHLRGWSDGGGALHRVTTETADSLIAEYEEQFRIDALSSGYGSAQIDEHWLVPGAYARVIATPQCGQRVKRWRGLTSADVRHGLDTVDVLMSRPRLVQVDFESGPGPFLAELADPDLRDLAPGSWSWVDYDGDGDQDLVGRYASGRTALLLLRNDRDRFTEVLAPGSNQPALNLLDVVGWSSVDYDGDGDQDFIGRYASGRSEPLLLRNDGDRFTEALAPGGHQPALTLLDPIGWSWIDYDHDNDKDLIGRYASGRSAPLLLRNDGDRFAEVLAPGSSQPALALLDPVGWSWIDYDGDADQDLVGHYANGSSEPLLLRNDGDRFTEVRALGSNQPALGLLDAAGWSWIDYDGDADQDLIGRYASGRSEPLLLRNDGDRFTEVRAPGSNQPALQLLDRTGWSWSDYDHDGDQDLIGRYASGRSEPLLLRNDGDRFTEVQAPGNNEPALGLLDPTGWSWIDFDQDDDEDLVGRYANRATTPLLLRNEGGRFTEVLAAGLANTGVLHDFVPEGLHWVDLDHDGDLDVLGASVSDVGVILSENFSGSFARMPSDALQGLSPTGLGFVDYDNDGLEDLWGLSRVGGDLVVLHNDRGDFSEVPDPRLSLISPSEARWGDLDRDGKPDLFGLGAQQSYLRLMLNAVPCANHWLACVLSPNVHPPGSAFGVEVHAGTYLTSTSQQDSSFHFGLGAVSYVDSLIVTWPSGLRQIVRHPPIDSVLSIREETTPGIPQGVSLTLRTSGGDFHFGVGDTVVADAGAAVELFVEPSVVTGNEPRWELDGERLCDGRGISGATTTSLRIDSIGPEHAGKYSLVVSNAAGTARSGAISLQVTGSGIGGPKVWAFTMERPRPNPFSGAVTIRYSLPTADRVRLEVFDLMGRKIARLIDGALPAGVHEFAWRPGASPQRTPPGVYFVRLSQGRSSRSRAVVYVP